MNHLDNIKLLTITHSLNYDEFNSSDKIKYVFNSYVYKYMQLYNAVVYKYSIISNNFTISFNSSDINEYINKFNNSLIKPYQIEIVLELP